MKQKRMFLIFTSAVFAFSLLIGAFFFINTPIQMKISMQEDVEVYEPTHLSVEVKNRIGQTMSVNKSKLNVSSSAGENMEVDGLNVNFSETGIFVVEATYGNITSNAVVVDVFKSPIAEVVDRTAISESNINPKVYFKLKHDFVFGNYNFDSDYTVDPVAWLDEYTNAYDKIYSGTKSEKQTAVDKLGNDILVRFVAIDINGNETIMSSKTKAWEGYLNISEGLDGTPQKLEGQNLGRVLSAEGENTYYSTAINMNTSVYLNSGYTLRTDLVIIADGKAYQRSYLTNLSR